MTATYIRRGQGKSDRAFDAEYSGMRTPSVWAKRIGKGVTAGDIIEALGVHEWHHTGKFAKETAYYDAEEIEDGMSEILKARDKRKNAIPEEATYRITWITFEKTSKYGSWKAYEHEFKGKAMVKGSFIYFNGMKKAINGKNIYYRKVKEVS